MMTALAMVTKIRPSKLGFEVELSCDQQTSCGSCAAKSDCGTGIVSNAIGKKSLTWHLATEKSLRVGQVVEIGLPENNLLKSAAILYLVPLLFMLLGALIGHYFLFFDWGEGAVIIFSALSAGAGFWFAKQLAREQERQSNQQVTLLRVLGEPIS